MNFVTERQPPFGLELRRLRVGVGLTQEELAERCRISVDAISALESGRRNRPRLNTVLMLADGLGLVPEERERLLAASRARGRPRGLRPAALLPPDQRAGLPLELTLSFVDREAELGDLEKGLREVGRVTIHGLGGVGKTQLAARYLQERRAAYPDGSFWLRSDQESGLVRDLAGLASRLELPERADPAPERPVDAVLRWLRRHPRWVLVLDDLHPETAEAVRRWLPPGLPGHTIVTSRTPVWPAHLRLAPLPVEVAARFLLTRTGQADMDAAAAVAEALGCLPLALEQAATYVEVSGRDLAGYAALLTTRLMELMNEGKPDDYPLPVAATWKASIERIESERPAAIALLRLCASLPMDDVSIGSLARSAGEQPEELRRVLVDAVEFDRTVAMLQRHSLVERQGDRLNLNQLLRAVLRATSGQADAPGSPPSQPGVQRLDGSARGRGSQ